MWLAGHSPDAVSETENPRSAVDFSGRQGEAPMNWCSSSTRAQHTWPAHANATGYTVQYTVHYLILCYDTRARAPQIARPMLGVQCSVFSVHIEWKKWWGRKSGGWKTNSHALWAWWARTRPVGAARTSSRTRETRPERDRAPPPTQNVSEPSAVLEEATELCICCIVLVT